MKKKRVRERTKTASKGELVNTADAFRYIGRLLAELCYFYSFLQSHDDRVITILQDKGIISRPELEDYARKFAVEKFDHFHLRFCEKKLKELGFPKQAVKLILDDLKKMKSSWPTLAL